MRFGGGLVDLAAAVEIVGEGGDEVGGVTTGASGDVGNWIGISDVGFSV